MSAIKIKKLGIAVSTYSEETTHPARYKIIEESLNSLLSSVQQKPKDIEVCVTVVADGPIPQIHAELLDKFSDDFEIIYREKNGGISKVKNTGIRTLLDKEIDLGALVDDDVFFHDDWISTYIKYIEDFQLHHHTWHDKRKLEHLKTIKPNSGALKAFSYKTRKGYDLFTHSGGCGIFLTFTPKLIESIGYFKVMPGKIGNEHQHFTLRANVAGFIGRPQDLINSYEFIEHIGVLNKDETTDQHVIHSVSDSFREKENKNSGLNVKDTDKYFPCIE